jgi:hypothetical protein
VTKSVLLQEKLLSACFVANRGAVPGREFLCRTGLLFVVLFHCLTHGATASSRREMVGAGLFPDRASAESPTYRIVQGAFDADALESSSFLPCGELYLSVDRPPEQVRQSGHIEP